MHLAWPSNQTVAIGLIGRLQYSFCQVWHNAYSPSNTVNKYIRFYVNDIMVRITNPNFKILFRDLVLYNACLCIVKFFVLFFGGVGGEGWGIDKQAYLLLQAWTPECVDPRVWSPLRWGLSWWGPGLRPSVRRAPPPTRRTESASPCPPPAESCRYRPIGGATPRISEFFLDPRLLRCKDFL